MNIVKSTHRTLAMLGVMFLAVLSAAAENVVELSLGNLKFKPGATTEVTIDLTNNVAAGRTVSGDIFLPEGFTFVNLKSSNQGAGKYASKTARSEEMDLMTSTKRENNSLAANQMRFAMYTADPLSKFIEAGSGAILTFKVKAPEEFSFKSKVVVKNLVISGIGEEGETLKKDEIEFPLVNATFNGSITSSDIEVTPGHVSTVTVGMLNDLGVGMLQGDIVLPEGLSFEKEGNRYLIAGQRVNALHKITTRFIEAENTLKFLVLPQDNEPNEIVGNEGTIFTFNVKGDAALVESVKIQINNIIGSSLSGDRYDFDNLTINVTNPDVEAGATADAAVTALKQKLTETETALKTYSEDIQTQLAEKLQALQEEVGEIETDVTEAKSNGTMAADLEAIQNRITKATENADALVEEAENLKKAADEATAANAAQNEADKAALEEVKTLLASTNETIATYDESVQEAMAEAKAAADAAIAAAETAITASFEAGTAVADKDANAALIEAAKEAVNKLAADAKAAQDKFLADEAAAAEAAQYEANQAAVTELKALLKEAEAAAKAAEYECADEVYEIKEDISVLRNKIETVHANNSSVATAPEVEAMVESIKAKIAAVKQGADDKAAADANEAQYKKDTLMVNGLEKSLETVTWNFNAEVVEIYGEEIAAIQDAIAALKATAKASYDNATSVADAEAFAAEAEKVKGLIEALGNSITTGISDINGEKSNEVTYDLSGRRVVKAKGMVIRNGKKYFVK